MARELCMQISFNRVLAAAAYAERCLIFLRNFVSLVLKSFFKIALPMENETVFVSWEI